MKKILNIVLAGSLIVLCFSCYYDEFLERTIPEGQIVSFSDDIQPIFNNSCIGCHNGVIAEPNLEAAASYDELVPEYVEAFDAEVEPLSVAARVGVDPHVQVVLKISHPH